MRRRDDGARQIRRPTIVLSEKALDREQRPEDIPSGNLLSVEFQVVVSFDVTVQLDVQSAGEIEQLPDVPFAREEQAIPAEK